MIAAKALSPPKQRCTAGCQPVSRAVLIPGLTSPIHCLVEECCTDATATRFGRCVANVQIHAFGRRLQWRLMPMRGRWLLEDLQTDQLVIGQY